MENSYRIHTSIGEDMVLQVPLRQDVDTLEILSLKISQNELYRLQESNYGIVVGRVLANESFGVPNAKLSIFVEVDADEIDAIKNLYPYTSATSKGNDGIKYNLLPNVHNDDCKRAVGSIPSKATLLDNDIYVEVFDKYLKYTTVTNNAGDYMIYGIPIGSHELHMSLDLSDIGILSQKPVDMIYKGHDINEFDSPTQFKSSTNLDDLAQIIQQTQSVNIYPLWGDREESVTAISRADIQVNYKFEPTCVFMGSIVSDNKSNALNHKCRPKDKSGANSQLVTSEGTIEMIRKTTNGLVESYQIKGNRLIDEDGVWCYQIPMNLDYVSTDEAGNVVASKNPNKGIPTRTRVRFRISKDETGEEGFSQHTAKYLVPNNPTFTDAVQPTISDPENFEKHFEFGSATREEDFRDLFWNNVYSVKSYIPRLQNQKSATTNNYSGLKNANLVEDQNPVPYNSARFRLPFIYVLLCIIIELVAYMIWVLNLQISVLTFLLNTCLTDLIPIPGGGLIKKILKKVFKFIFCLPQYILKKTFELIPGFKDYLETCIAIKGIGDTPNTVYAPGCYDKTALNNIKCPDPEDYPHCNRIISIGELMDQVQRKLAIYYNIVRLDFTNDWINGVLYYPLWYWKKRKKKSYLFGLIKRSATNQYCDCTKTNFKKNRLWHLCSFSTTKNLQDDGKNPIEDKNWHKRKKADSVSFKRGVVQTIENKDGLLVYYYTPLIPIADEDTNAVIKNYTKPIKMVLMYATDIILIGNLNDKNLYGIPQLFNYLPPTTSNVPEIATEEAEEDNEEQTSDETYENTYVAVTGMDWGRHGDRRKPKYSSGLLLDLGCTSVTTRAKTCVNVDRISEFGVDLDMSLVNEYSNGTAIETGEIPADGMITKFELSDDEHRAMFATLNHLGFNPKDELTYDYDRMTGYIIPRFKYMYPTNFDGRMSNSAKSFTSSASKKTYDEYDASYALFKQGENPHFYNVSPYKFPVFNNSYYFYFGLNPGKTAIEKFTSQYTAVCPANEEYPFNVDVTYQSKSSCITNDKKYPYIILTIEDIETPYSYQLMNSSKEVLYEDYDITTKVLKLGFQMDEDGNYTEENDGIVYGFNNDETYELENILYRIKVTDANGSELTFKVDLKQPNLTIEYEAIGLGTSYYDGITKKEDICNEKQLYGEIYISSIKVDGIDESIDSYTIIGDTLCVSTSNAEYGTSHSGDNGILLKFTPSEGGDMTECGCKETPDVKYPKITFGKLENEESQLVERDGVMCIHLFIYKPMAYLVEIVQKCEGIELLTNKGSQVINVNNGDEFIGLINSVPFNLILGENWNNTNFYPESGKFSSTITGKDVRGWFYVNQENYYDMLELNEENLSMWNTFVQPDTSFSLVNERTITDVLEYKFKSLFSLSSGAYEISYGNAGYSFETTGGTAPILQRMAQIDVSSIDSSTQPKTGSVNYIFSEDSVYSNDENLCDLVPVNYVYFDKDGNRQHPKPSRTDTAVFNPYFVSGDKIIGEFFGGFTKNGGIINAKTGEIDNSVKYVSVPKNAYPKDKKPIGTDLTATVDAFQNGEWSFIHTHDKTKPTAPYLRSLTIDRRIDYDLFVMAPSTVQDLYITTNTAKNYVWRTGRLSGITYNGIELAYDDNYNIISLPDDTNKLEYTYSKTGATAGNTIYNKLDGENDQMRRLYGANIGELLDLRDKFWSSEKNKLKKMSEYVAGSINLDNIYATILNLAQSLGITSDISSFNINSLQANASTMEFVNNILYYFDHSSDKNLYNGVFSADNYPTRRLIDIGCIPPMFSSFDINLASNDYADINVETTGLRDNDDETSEITGYTLSTSMKENNANEAIVLSLSNMVNIVSDGKVNAVMLYNEKNNTFSASTFNFSFQFNSNDEVIENSDVFLRKPMLMKVISGDTSYIGEMKMAASRKDADAIPKTARLAYVDTLDGVDDAKWDKEEYFCVGDERTSLSDVSLDDLTFSMTSSSKYDNVYALFLREDIYNGDEFNLTKHIELYSWPVMIDLRPISLSCTQVENETTKYGNTAQETTTDASGNTVVTTEASEKMSRLHFEIKCSGTTLNHAFTNKGALTIESAWFTYKDKNPITTTISTATIDDYEAIDSSNGILKFHIDWTPDMGLFNDQNFSYKTIGKAFRDLRFWAQMKISVRGMITYGFLFTFDTSGNIKYLPNYSNLM